jgi:hypothetical protein
MSMVPHMQLVGKIVFSWVLKGNLQAKGNTGRRPWGQRVVVLNPTGPNIGLTLYMQIGLYTVRTGTYMQAIGCRHFYIL